MTEACWEIERSCFDRGIELVCGVDEAGAGPLAGDVYAAAVILPRDFTLPYLNDSKKVTPKRRDILFDQIKEGAIAWSVGVATAQEIDELDILNCRMLAMNRAIAGLSPQPDFVLVDGNRNHGSKIAIELPNEMVVKGDSKSASIAAASILAKVSRDRYMEEMAKQYPEYLFEKHKGYGTKLHYEMLDQYGPSPVHRMSFLKSWEARRHG
jgi:ribonuclease HII